MDYFAQQVINGLQLGFVYALIALGYPVVYGIVRLINSAPGDVFMIGAFIGFYTIELYHLPLALVFLSAMAGCTVLAVLIELLAYRPLRHAPKIASLITAIGVSLFLEYFTSLRQVFGPNFYSFPRPFPVVIWEVGGILVTTIGASGPGVTARPAAVLGGIGNIPGAVLGGPIMGQSETMVSAYLSSTYRDGIAFVILILVLLWKPTGILGAPRAEKVC